MVSILVLAGPAEPAVRGLLPLLFEVCGLALLVFVEFLLFLYLVASLVTYIEFLCSEEGRLWWAHPPGSAHDSLHSIRRLHRTALRRVRAWVRLRRLSGAEQGRRTTRGASRAAPSDPGT